MKPRENFLDATLVLIGIGIGVYGLFFAEQSVPFILNPWDSFPR